MDRRTGPNQFATYQPTNFFHKESKSKKKKNFFFQVGGGVFGWCESWWGRGTWMDRQTGQTNLPLQLLPSWEHNNALMYKLCP